MNSNHLQLKIPPLRTDVGILTLSQYILLDPILLFFIAGSFMGSAKFNNCYREAFSA